MVAVSASAASAQDVAKGETAFHKCLPCHSIGDDAQIRSAPCSTASTAATPARVPDYNYSDANKNSGIVWDETSSRNTSRTREAMVPGTKMTFAGIKNEQEINDLWAYISQFNADGSIKKRRRPRHERPAA